MRIGCWELSFRSIIHKSRTRILPSHFCWNKICRLEYFTEFCSLKLEGSQKKYDVFLLQPFPSLEINIVSFWKLRFLRKSRVRDCDLDSASAHHWGSPHIITILPRKLKNWPPPDFGTLAGSLVLVLYSGRGIFHEIGFHNTKQGWTGESIWGNLMTDPLFSEEPGILLESTLRRKVLETFQTLYQECPKRVWIKILIWKNSNLERGK